MPMQRLIESEQIRETKEEESEPKNEHFQTEKLKKYLQELYNTREKLQCSLQDVEKQIENMESNLQNTISPGRSILVKRLLETEELAKIYSMITLKKFPALQEEINYNRGGIDNFTLEIEGWLEKIGDALRYDNLSFLDCSHPTLYLLNSLSYKYADSKVYNELFEVIKKDLSRNLSEEDKKDLYDCVNSLEIEVLRFV
jgi:hypothetical protein